MAIKLSLMNLIDDHTFNVTAGLQWKSARVTITGKARPPQTKSAHHTVSPSVLLTKEHRSIKSRAETASPTCHTGQGGSFNGMWPTATKRVHMNVAVLFLPHFLPQEQDHRLNHLPDTKFENTWGRV
jgi:hypothetical protein